MPLGKRQRKILRALIATVAGVLTALVLLWLALPLWFPWVLRPLARGQGFFYSRYEREGYRHFALHGFGFTNQTIRVGADKIELLIPTAWLWRTVVKPEPRPELFLRAGTCHLESFPSDTPASPVGQQVRDVAAVLQILQKWFPAAAVSKGTIRLQETILEVSNLSLSRGSVQAEIALPQLSQGATVSADLSRPQPYEVQLNSDSLHLKSAIRVDANALTLQSTSWWRSNRIDLAAQSGPSEDWPQKAALEARNFHLPPELVSLPGYQGVDGSVSASWEGGQFGLDLDAQAQPAPGQANLPPVNVVLHARGDTNAAVIQSVSISSPGLKAELSRELSVFFHGKLLREPARLKIAADLSRQPWVPLQGIVSGEADLSPGTGTYPSARFQFSGSEIGIPELRARSLAVQGRFDWPWLELTRADAKFEDGSIAVVSGKAELEKTVLADGHCEIRGGLARRWLPSGYGYAGASVSADFHGPLNDLVHSGQLEVTNFTSPDLQPLRVHAQWSGQATNLHQAEVTAQAGGSSLVLQGALPIGGSRTDLELTALTLSTNGQPVLELAQPCRVSLERTGSTNQWRFKLAPFNWTGKDREIHARGLVDWPRAGDVELAMRNVSATLLSGFFKTNLPEVDIQSLSATAGWTNGPAAFRLALLATERARLRLREAATNQPAAAGVRVPLLTAKVELTGNQNGITVSNLLVMSQTSTVAVAHGFLPVSLSPGAPAKLIGLDLDHALEFSASTQPHAFFWDTLTEWTGIKLSEPNLNLNLSGTWKAPAGVINVDVRQIQFSKSMTNLPTLEKLQASVRLDREQARLTQGQLLVQGQRVAFNGEVPLGESFWAGLREGKLPNWERAHAQVKIEQAEIAAFQPLIPTVLAPQGQLSMDLALLPGGRLGGQIFLAHARTRPLGAAGSIRDINLKLKFLEHALRLETASATLGGAELKAYGEADLRGTGWMKGETPPFQLGLSGLNVPLSRQPTSIIRSDLNLMITLTNGAPPVISGLARLRDSFYLSDLAALVPGKVASPSQRPPYFSIDDPPLADCRLLVRVEGPGFLKVRSPLFNGQVSTTLDLQGTLQDPIALGDVKINSGTVRFPFANLEVKQGFVTLTSQDPYRPTLSVRAASRQYGYDIRMDVSGPVDAPILQFTSTPPLASEQILLMITAGELPRGEFSLTPQQKAQTVAVFLGRDLLSKLGFGDKSEPRLTISSGEEVSQQGKPTYHIEYKLSERWAVEGEYDRFGDFNAGFKWRVFSK